MSNLGHLLLSPKKQEFPEKGGGLYDFAQRFSAESQDLLTTASAVNPDANGDRWVIPALKSGAKCRVI